MYFFLVEVHNITLIPSNNTMKIIEGTSILVTCVVNRNASPAPNITWFLGSIDITSIAGGNASTIIITGNRTDNTKMLKCEASNNIKQPRMANTTLLVECMCIKRFLKTFITYFDRYDVIASNFYLW